MSWTRFSRGLLPGKNATRFGPPGQRCTNVLLQSGEDLGDGVGPFDFEPQRPENDRVGEGKDWTHLRWILLPLWRRTETWVEEGFRAQETAEGCAVAMHQKWLREKYHPRLVLVCWVRHLLPGLPI